MIIFYNRYRREFTSNIFSFEKLACYTIIIKANTKKNPNFSVYLNYILNFFLSHKKPQTFIFVPNLPLLTFPFNITVNNYFFEFFYFSFIFFFLSFSFFPPSPSTSNRRDSTLPALGEVNLIHP